MRVPRIYTAQTLREASVIELAQPAAHHISRVLRMKPGHNVVLFNGDGGEYHGSLVQVGKQSVTVRVDTFSAHDPQSPLTTELGICLLKSDKMDWLVQKATELGVTGISPLLSEFTDSTLPAEHYPKKLEHWRRISVNACQQCGRTRLPAIHCPRPLTEWLAQSRAEYQCLLHPTATQPLAIAAKPGSIALLVGPEGGLSEAEVALAVADNFIPATLGPRILRAETATLSALAILQYHHGDLGGR